MFRSSSNRRSGAFGGCFGLLEERWTDDGCSLVSTVAAVAGGSSAPRPGGLGLSHHADHRRNRRRGPDFLAERGLYALSASGLPAATDFVEFDVFDTEVASTAIVVNAYDIEGNTVHSEVYVAPPSTVIQVTLSIPAIHRLVLESDEDGCSFDNLRFNDVVTPVVFLPTIQPLAMVLLAAGLVSSAMWRLRQKAGRRQ